MDFLYGIITGLCLALTALFLGGLMKLIWPQPPGWLRVLRRSEPKCLKCSQCGAQLGYNGQCLVCWQRELWPQPSSEAEAEER